jgi:hypothetical protein
MIRRFNYTKRIRIDKKDISITLQQGKELSFVADLAQLKDYSLPGASQVFIEAYRQTRWMRFNWGTIENLNPSLDCTLSQFDTSDDIRFRVKVTQEGDQHKLLAEADGISFLQPETQNDTRSPLLPVQQRELGEVIYQVEYDPGDDHPRLLINSLAGNYKEISRASGFQALVYPSVLREILTRYVIIDKHDGNEVPGEADSWGTKWIKFASQLPGIGPLPDADEEDRRQDWIDQAVILFAKRIQVRAKFDAYWKALS